MTIQGACAALLAFLQAIAAFGQPPQPPAAPLSPAAEKIRTQAADLPIGGKVTVDMRNGRQYYGNLHSIESESFSIREVDMKMVRTLRYEEVRKVRKDYGRRGFSGKRVHPNARLVGALVALGLVVLAIVLVASDKS